ncbi:DUF2793 domain-containing protein [Mesorhizobium newzealandense]|uniref:DUF2793 domain-containing protein n=1 Tax=Mesorhizobium newzealandense TaxID=1300302 RepID=A0ABW4U5A4_9HYPH
MTTSNRLGITELAETQNNRSVTVNEAIAKLEAGAFCFPAVSIGDTAPPGSPAEGDVYCLGASPTGAWTGKATKVAEYYNSAWLFLPAIEGALAYAQDVNAYYFFDGSAWSLLAGGGGAGDVVGPASAVDGHIVQYNGTTGKLIKDGLALDTDGTLAANSDTRVASQKAVKTYVDGLVVNLGNGGKVRAATAANITISTALNNGDSLDGVTLATDDLVLVKDQSSPAQNGIYVVGVSPARVAAFDTYDEHPGSIIVVEEGSTNADTLWLCTSNAGGTLNTTAIAYTQLVLTGTVPSARTITAGTGLTGGGDLSANRTIAADIGKQTVWVPAGAMVPRTTNGAATGTAEMATNKNMLATLDFDTTTQEFAQFDIRMPKSWNEGTVTFIPVWSHAATTTNFGVAFGLDAVAVSDGDALDVAFGTAVVVTDTGGTTNTSYQGAESGAVTVSGSPAAGDLVMFRIHRDPANGSDTMAIDARLHGVVVLYVIDTLKDD